MSLRDLSLESQYSTSMASLIEDFLSPVISASTSYDRAAGYFNSSLFVLAPAAWADFFLRGGRMRLLTSVELSRNDANSILHGDQDSVDLRQSFFNTWSELMTYPQGEFTSRLLRALVASGSLDLRVAAYRNPRGLFHDKLGVLESADGARVSFTGSANETFNAWSGFGNHESLDVFRSWQAEDLNRVEAHRERFEGFWQGDSPGLEVFAGEELADVIVGSGPEEEVGTLIEEFREKLVQAIPSLSTRRRRSSGLPEVSLRPYQQTAVENWEKAGRRGIISFATGGGKTLTALEIIRSWSQGGSPTLILVPSEILVTQWIKEIYAFFEDVRVLRTDSNSRVNWKSNLGFFLNGNRDGPPRLVIGTYRGFSSESFIKLIPNKSDLLVVGDEVHRFGAPNTRAHAKFLSPKATLGLSATPIRQFDDEGSESIYDFFGPALEPEYTLSTAIREGNLVPYKFSFFTTALNDVEQQKWDRLSRSISRSLASSKNQEKPSASLKRLLIDRARIAKMAHSKTELAAKIVSDNFFNGDRWLVYCETNDHLDAVKSEIRRILKKVPVMTYTSSNEDEHDAVLKHFETEGGVLMAIRCLDEGVDIPLINKAVIVSSSQSRREFIQRRGRILRPHAGKHVAELFDFLMESENGEVLMPRELDRLVDFAADAINQEPHIRLKSLRALQGSQPEGDANE